MFDPDGSNETHSQWIELYNDGDSQIILDEKFFGIIDEFTLSISKDKVHYLNCHSIKDSFSISPGKFLIIAKNKDAFKNDYPSFDGNVIEGTFGLSTKSSRLRLSNDRCATFFLDLLYEKSWGGSDNKMSLEKINLKHENSRENWQESHLIGGTPGLISSLPTKEELGEDLDQEKPNPEQREIIHPEEEPKLGQREDIRTEVMGGNIFINELLPNPSPTKEEFIELYNPNEKEVNLAGWILRDASKTGKYIFPPNTLLQALSFLAVYKSAFKFALNNSGSETVSLLDPQENLVSTVTYIGSKKDLSYNFNGSSWRWSKFLTAGLDNVFNNLPQSKNKIPKKAYQNAYVDFSTKATDKDNDKLKYTWDFGDGHKSYLKKTRHKYEKTGKYIVTLKTFDGSEDKIETFPLEIKKFPKFDVEIIALAPNPAGKDAGAEYITLRSNEKKKVDLKGWSIATGWKNMVNHPIAESLIIKPKAELKLTNLDSKFTLQNKFSKIELRYPSGKVASKLKYKKDDGISDGEIYQKEKGGWMWKATLPIETKDAEEAMITENIPSAPEPSIDLMQVETQNEGQRRQEIVLAIANNLGHFSPVQKSDLPVRKIEEKFFPFPNLILPATPTKNLYSTDKTFFFTPVQEKPHFIISLLHNLFFSINSRINSFLTD